MDRRLTRSRAKDIANEVPVHPDVAPTNEEAPTQTTKALKSRKREPEQPKQPEHDDTQQEEDAHKDKKAKSMAASSSIKSIPVLKVGDTIPDVELLDDEGKSTLEPSSSSIPVLIPLDALSKLAVFAIIMKRQGLQLLTLVLAKKN
ncbi:hypothetical protein HK097_008729 [Rhizophlyctis rosea]|uniref:Uncharacterized protein n=1 Tax=Rhizophlyctis rosea TaxID=64517 RepID=A0AAD5SJB5_9FUNG|nr:hypothetical protein HK097_008729 [Rhizophlyctis rosea]